METTLDLTRHPVDSTSVLNWMLLKWDEDSRRPLLILTKNGDGEPLDNRLRVRLSTIRKSLKASGNKHFKQFGFTSRIILWTLEDGSTLDALYVTYQELTRHRMVSLINNTFR